MANEQGVLYGLELMKKDNLTIIPVGFNPVFII